MKVLLAFPTLSHALRVVPGAMGGGGYGSGGPIGAGGYQAGLQAGAGGTAALSQLLSQLGGGSGGAGGADGTGAGGGAGMPGLADLKDNPAERGAKAKFVEAAKNFEAAEHVDDSAQEKAQHAAILNRVMGMASRSAASQASFVDAPLSQEELASIGNAALNQAQAAVPAHRDARCPKCHPSYNECPAGFAMSKGSCEPTSSYNGICAGFAPSDHEPVALLEAETTCDFCFPCESNQASFAFALDAKKVKNGLFVTQPMRSPSPFTLNVIERGSAGARGDAVAMAEARAAGSAYSGFEDGLATLK